MDIPFCPQLPNVSFYEDMYVQASEHFPGRKANTQYRELRERNPNDFVWLDEPGLGWLFSGMSGYGDLQARADYETL